MPKRLSSAKAALAPWLMPRSSACSTTRRAIQRTRLSSSSISRSTAAMSSPPDMIATTSSRLISDLREGALAGAAVEQREDVGRPDRRG